MTGAVVIHSGGLDSTVCLALAARHHGSPPLALCFDYGQRHRLELERAGAIASLYGSERLVVRIDASSWGGSALTDSSMEVPDASPELARASLEAPAGARSAAAPHAGSSSRIPVTYVPARNSIFLAIALGVAEARDAEDVYIGVNALDYSGYPDCRPEFLDAFREVAVLGQRRGIEGRPVEIRAPLLSLSKADIVKLGARLGAPLGLTWSCYREGPRPCGKCDACSLRAKGFAEAGIADPAAA